MDACLEAWDKPFVKVRFDFCLSDRLPIPLTELFLQGTLIADQNGLCISAKGELDCSLAGTFVSMSRHVSSIESDASAAPTILIETNNRNILVKEYDSLTVVLRSSREEKPSS